MSAKEKTTKEKAETSTKKKKTRGVIIVAVNHHNYGKYAFQLAMSIKHTSPNMQIALAHDGAGASILNETELSIFDKVIKVNPSILQDNGRRQVLRFKAFLYDMTPFDETVYLDADILWSPKTSIDELFKSIPKNCKFTMQNRGAIDLGKADDNQLNSAFSIWVNSKKLKEAYGFKAGQLFNLSSELIYFQKDEKVAEFFKQVKVEFSTIKVSHLHFNGGIPDELPFAIAMIKTKMYPHQQDWRPIYWEAFDKRRLLTKPAELYSDYMAVSFGGNVQENFIKKFYNNLAQYYCNQFGVQYPFPLKDKRSFIPERHSI